MRTAAGPGRLRVGVKKALLCLVEGVSDGRGPLETSVIIFILRFHVSHPVLSSLYEQAPSFYMESPGRQPDYVHFTDEDTEAQRGDIAGSAGCRWQHLDWKLSRLPPEPNTSPEQ